MSNADMVQIVGYMVSAWCVGFSGGYILTRFREALNMTV